MRVRSAPDSLFRSRMGPNVGAEARRRCWTGAGAGAEPPTDPETAQQAWDRSGPSALPGPGRGEADGHCAAGIEAPNTNQAATKMTNARTRPARRPGIAQTREKSKEVTRASVAESHPGRRCVEATHCGDQPFCETLTSSTTAAIPPATTEGDNVRSADGGRRMTRTASSNLSSPTRGFSPSFAACLRAHDPGPARRTRPGSS